MRIFVLLFAVFMDIILLTRFKMNLKTVMFCVGLELVAFFCFNTVGFYSLFLCFFLIGILKWFRKLVGNYSDVYSYKMSNFMYSAGIPIALCCLEFVITYFSKNIAHNHQKIDLLIVCSIAAIISDSAASEMGQLFKGKTYSIINFCLVDPGEDGGISFGGTLSAMLLTFFFMVLTKNYIDYTIEEFFIVYSFSMVSCMLDSVLGATIQKKGIISNEQTNFFAVLFTVLLVIFI